MTTFGKNMRLTVDEKHRTITRRMFTEVLGCAARSPAPELEVYSLEDGFGIGVYYVDSKRALNSADQQKAPWLELLVDDPEQTHARLGELGIPPFEYTDKSHRYYCPPGGPVFRLAKRG